MPIETVPTHLIQLVPKGKHCQLIVAKQQAVKIPTKGRHVDITTLFQRNGTLIYSASLIATDKLSEEKILGFGDKIKHCSKVEGPFLSPQRLRCAVVLWQEYGFCEVMIDGPSAFKSIFSGYCDAIRTVTVSDRCIAFVVHSGGMDTIIIGDEKGKQKLASVCGTPIAMDFQDEDHLEITSVSGSTRQHHCYQKINANWRLLPKKRR